MKEGLMLADRLGCHNIIAESGSSDTSETCLGSETWWNDSASIDADCVDLVASIREVTFNHRRSDANKSAHEVAKECFLNNLSCKWDDEFPSFLLQTLLNDVIAE
jgi:hypothetical protein